MPSTQDLLKQAIAAARAGREWTARDMFLQIVLIEPRNELAWMWLSGLLDELDDRIRACERALEINPQNFRAAQYLSQLQAEKQKQREAETARLMEKLDAARQALKSGNRDAALADLRALALNPHFAPAELWRMLADASSEWEERAQALERLAELEPQGAPILSLTPRPRPWWTRTSPRACPSDSWAVRSSWRKTPSPSINPPRWNNPTRRRRRIESSNKCTPTEP